MEQKSTFWKSAMTAGLYLGVILILYNVILYITGQNLNTSLGIVSYVILAAGVYYFQQQYRNRELGGYISYGNAVGYGVALMAFAGIIQSVYTVILMKFIDPGILDQIRIMQEEQLMKQGVSDEQIEMASKMMDAFRSPIVIAISGLFSFALLGVIISLVSSIFIKKNDDDNAFDEAMSDVKSED
ncbi:DUF4199 domain-containing protein [Mangrovibacterium lignilyticum]|uniref:DUF4199 domain-containing protein n=1 Tax=Mangrovibacterium lignilyticum TaxID=2668052 RepID=UPI0013D425BA|nr:DUF4199 domain-containing protein [Mangrovibacterium lignilyticum]